MAEIQSRSQERSNDLQSGGEQILSIQQRRWRKFRSLKRGYYSLVLLVVAYIVSFFLPLLVNNRALVVHYNGRTYFPAVRDLLDLPLIGQLGGTPFIAGEELGQAENKSECNYRALKRQYEQEGKGNYVIMPLYPFGPIEDISVEGNEPFMPPLTRTVFGHLRLFGTDDRGRDVFARMAYGFQISFSFALLVATLSYLIGVPLGALMGYFGRWFDLLMQRFMEIWGSLPFLFLIIIVVSIVRPSFFVLVLLLVIFSWLGIAQQMRAQFYREKTRDYTAAAISIGVPTWRILLRHILPNSMVPIITFFPFAVVGDIGALVSLDFLGFGLAPPTPSWGEMVSIGMDNLTNGYWWLVLVPLGALFLTLMLVVFIGEAVRDAFDPKTFSRLR